jgi:2-oxoisovalerate dehydrogenase E2 component (dihydrolipoyl transacylase)
VAKVTMPQLGESVAEGTIGKWLKKPGDHVARSEPLLEVITDKVNAEVPSPFEGILTEILVQEGETVPNDAEIAVIEESASAGASAAAPAAPASAAPSAPAVTPAAPASGAPTGSNAPMASASAAVAAPPEAPDSPPATNGDANARMSPAVRRLLREHGITAAQVRGTGAAGRITRDDVQAFLAVRTSTGAPPGEADRSAAPATAPTPASPSTGSATLAPARPGQMVGNQVEFEPGQDEVLIGWTQMRRGIATAMVRSTSTVPRASTTVEVDTTNLVRLRAAHKDSFRAREGANLSYVPFIVKAIVEALRRHPRINAHWSEAGLLVKRRINVGIAVAVDDGLIVPVIHDADQLSISGLNRAVLDLADRARNNRLRLDDIQGGTITLNNTGTFGSTISDSIVNAPEVAIINLEAIVKRPVVLETADGDVIAIRSMMNLPVAFDHRSTDGAQIGRFAGDIKAWIEAIGPETPIY